MKEDSAHTPLAWIQNATRGDREAAERIIESILPRVRNLVRYLVRSDGEVDDIAQQCLVSILKGLPQYRGEGDFHAWIDRITARRTFQEIRKARATRLVQSELPVELIATETTDEYLHRRQVVRLLDQLPDAQRQAIVLHHVIGMTVPEVAEFLEVSFDTAKSRLRLGLKKLRQTGKGQSVDHA